MSGFYTRDSIDTPALKFGTFCFALTVLDDLYIGDSLKKTTQKLLKNHDSPTYEALALIFVATTI